MQPRKEPGNEVGLAAELLESSFTVFAATLISDFASVSSRLSFSFIDYQHTLQPVLLPVPRMQGRNLNVNWRGGGEYSYIAVLPDDLFKSNSNFSI